MIPTLVRTPFDRPGWVFEEKVDGEKVDGWRILAYKGGARVRLVSRKGITQEDRFSELAAAIAQLAPVTLVLDGEGVDLRRPAPLPLRLAPRSRSRRRRLAAALHGVRPALL